MSRLSSLVLPLILAMAPVTAAPPISEPAKPGEIVVTGHGPDRDKRDRQAVNRIAAPVSLGGFEAQYGRWEVPICVGVAGLPADHAQLIADRIGQIADGLKIKVEGPGCHPNIYIVVTNQPDDFIRKSRTLSGSLLGNLDPAQLEIMQRSRNAVRWAGRLEQIGRMGDVPQPYGSDTGGRTQAVTMKTLGSLIKPSVTTRLVRMVVIVDGNQIGGLRYSTLSGYLAMVSLAQLRPDADAQMVNTVLSAFRDRAAAPDDLTDFDHAYLVGLYTMQAENKGDVQRQQIVRRINQELNKPTTR